MNNVAEWVEVVDDKEMINAFVDEKAEFLEIKAVFSVENDGKADVNMENPEEKNMTFLEAEEALKNLTMSYKKLGIPEATNVHLEHLKKALFKAKTVKREEHQYL